jgi:hypothetical protein
LRVADSAECTATSGVSHQAVRGPGSFADADGSPSVVSGDKAIPGLRDAAAAMRAEARRRYARTDLDRT